MELSGLRANKVGDLDAVLKEAIATDKPVVVDVPTYPYENCYPMIPAGGCNHEMILEDPPELKSEAIPGPGQADKERFYSVGRKRSSAAVGDGAETLIGSSQLFALRNQWNTLFQSP